MPRGAAAPSATMAGVVWHPASQDFPMKHTFLAPMASGYKYAEGGVNLAMLPAGGSLSDGVRVLQVERACACEAVRWTEELTGRCATAHCTAHVFISRDHPLSDLRSHRRNKALQPLNRVLCVPQGNYGIEMIPLKVR